MKDLINIGERLEKYLYKNNVSDDEWLKVLNVVEDYSGIKSIKDYAKENNISVQTVYKNRKIYTFLNTKFVIDE